MSRLKGKAIPGWPGYRVTAGGDVYSTRRGGCRLLKQEWSHPHEQDRARRGHLRVGLYDGNGKRSWCYVHHLVALTYIGRRPSRRLVCHRNGNPADNRQSNLYYGTPSCNALDREHHRRAGRGCHRG